MKRSAAHVMFGAAALTCAALALYQGVQLREAVRINEAMRGALAVESLDSDIPQARFAQAVLWSATGASEAASNAYKELSQMYDGPLRLDALYNLGNLHLREALRDGPHEALRSLPLIELAKQRYRDVLRDEPSHWDARYNLELALRLAPESDDPLPPEEDPPDVEDRVISTLPGRRIDLP